MLLQAQKIQKSYGERLIFELESLAIYRGDKIGIVGNNGAGKSTLLKVLAGVLAPDSGSISRRGTVAYVAQLSQNSGENDAFDTQNSDFSAHSATNRDTQNSGFSAHPATNRDTQNSDFAAQSNIFSAFSATANPKSGGEVMRRRLADAFAQGFDILALDEPTSNLDADGIAALDAMLYGAETLLLISHDRQLLCDHCNKIIEVEGGAASVLCCGFIEYENEVQRRKQEQNRQYEQYIHEKKRLERAVSDARARASKMNKTPSRMGNSEARLHKRETTAKQAKVLEAGSGIASRLQRLEAAEKPREARPMRLDFSLTDPPQNKIVISCDDLCFGYGDRVIFSGARLEIANGAHTAVAGANGSGKSTLLRLICERSDIIYRVPKARIGYMRQDFSDLDFNAPVLQNVTDTAVQPQAVCRNVLANMGFRGDDVYKKTGVLSGGELVKASLARLIVSDCNVLVLDEPTNYLDISSIAQVQDALTAYEGTVIFVSHDQSFVGAVADSIIEIRDRELLARD